MLQTATSNAARFLGNSSEAGTITTGSVADMVLLNANPLDNVDNIFLPEGVVLRGKWFPEDDLQKNLAADARASSLASVANK